MNILFSILLLFVFCYAVYAIVTAFTWFSKKEIFENNFSGYISIVIPARNEAKNTGACLRSIVQQEYDSKNFEIIVVNDCSEDETSSEVKKIIKDYPQINISLIELKENNFHKKGALIEGIKAAKGKIIITRDADTFSVSKKWLGAIVSCFQNKNTAMVICPVTLSEASGLSENFQLCENYTLQVIGGGSALLGFPFLCNGANLAFLKTAFNDVNGFEGNIKTASGDDIFLLEKFRKKYPGSISYCSNFDSLVSTYPEKNFTSFLHQKVRWTSKFSKTLNGINVFPAVSVFLIHFLFMFLALLSLIFEGWYKFLVLSILIKWLIDFLLLILAGIRFKHWSWIKWFIPLEIINIFYSIFIPFATIFIRPKWKERKIRQQE